MQDDAGFYSTSCNALPTVKNGLLLKMPHSGATKPTTPHFVMR